MGRRLGVALHLFDEQHWVIRVTAFPLSLDVQHGFFIEYGTLGLQVCGVLGMIRGKAFIFNLVAGREY
jgi:hypothetical protein